MKRKRDIEKRMTEHTNIEKKMRKNKREREREKANSIMVIVVTISMPFLTCFSVHIHTVAIRNDMYISKKVILSSIEILIY